MMRKTVVAGLVATSLLAGMLGGAGSASAATESVLTVTPVEPGLADVCWTPYDPAPDPGSVDFYRLTAPDLLDIPITAPPSAFADGPGRYCVHFSNLPSGKRYTFSLEAQVSSNPFVEAAPELVAHYYALSADFSRTHVKVGQVVTVSGTLKAGSKGQAGATVIVQRRALTTDTWSQVGTVTTDSQGRYKRSFKVRTNVKVRTYFKGIPGGTNGRRLELKQSDRGLTGVQVVVREEPGSARSKGTRIRRSQCRKCSVACRRPGVLPAEARSLVALVEVRPDLAQGSVLLRADPQVSGRPEVPVAGQQCRP